MKKNYQKAVIFLMGFLLMLAMGSSISLASSEGGSKGNTADITFYDEKKGSEQGQIEEFEVLNQGNDKGKTGFLPQLGEKVVAWGLIGVCILFVGVFVKNKLSRKGGDTDA